MPRPNTHIPAEGPTNTTAPAISAATIVCIPVLKGYWEESLEVAIASIGSLRKSLRGVAHELVVFDNASCPPAQKWLRGALERGEIDLLIESAANIGKLGALNQLVPACRAPIVGYFDSDVLFLDGWYQRTKEIIDAFPNVGMVTALPWRSPHPALSSSTTEFGEADPETEVKRGDLIPKQRMVAFGESIGREVPEIGDDRQDVVLRRRGVSALVYAGHFQFAIPKKVASAILPLPVTEAAGRQTRTIDSRINELGCLRLSSTEPLVHHAGNRLGKQGRELLGQTPEPASPRPAPSEPASTPSGVSRLLGMRRVRLGLEIVEKRLFNMIYLEGDRSGRTESR